MYEEIREKKSIDQRDDRRALLVSVYQGTDMREVCGEHLTELEFLCETYGLKTVGKIPCQVRKYDASTFVTKGKLEELMTAANETEADLIVFDDEIAPSQQRNLEELFGKPVIDRTEVILGVFAQRAQTKEAQLQVELAQLKYQAPRLKRMWTHLSRQAGTAGGGGGGAYLKGKGEKQIEIDRRLLKDKVHGLTKELDVVRAIRQTQRGQRERSGIPVFGIIGYTNAGKSTLLNSLTEAGVFVEDKLFATLDTTTRKYTLPNNEDILLVDTVGFIRKLPHLLVAAFKSTLEESIDADILLHLVDASHPMAEEQAEASLDVLKELGAHDKHIITVLNKIDKCEDKSILNKLRIKYPHTVQISALKRTGFEALIEEMVEELKKRKKVIELRIPQKDYAIVSEIMRLGKIINQEYEENDILLRVELPGHHSGRFQKYLVAT